ncbi:hypothetical protein [Acinetobacter johnsonii]|uniref:hypothetical protein n=1 Tax=Acinetobacter johnsonii TaxID=40214 RepID=UPI003F5620D5
MEVIFETDSADVVDLKKKLNSLLEHIEQQKLPNMRQAVMAEKSIEAFFKTKDETHLNRAIVHLKVIKGEITTRDQIDHMIYGLEIPKK